MSTAEHVLLHRITAWPQRAWLERSTGTLRPSEPHPDVMQTRGAFDTIRGRWFAIFRASDGELYVSLDGREHPIGALTAEHRGGRLRRELTIRDGSGAVVLHVRYRLSLDAILTRLDGTAYQSAEDQDPGLFLARRIGEPERHRGLFAGPE